MSTNTKECLHRQLTRARAFTEKLLSDFHTPEEWTHQVHKNANHALWFAGHMAIVDNFFVSVLDPSRVARRPELEEHFGMGSTPVADPAAYPSPEEVLTLMRERRATLMEIFNDLSEDQLAEPTPPQFKDLFATKGGVFELAVWHEGLHSGQVSVARRAIGNSPVLG